jgi:S-formylglutathione hydrolase FrmB
MSSNDLTTVESSGTMSLLTDGTNYFLQPNGGTPVELSYGGSPVTVGEFASYGAWTPIAAAQTASGYEVAWSIPGADQYQIWLTDSSGNEVSIPFLGSGAQVAAYETSFNHDLNGDGILTDGTNYFLQPKGGMPVEFSYGGSPVTVGEFAAYGAWTPIAAAQTASGYEVAWSIPGANQYQIWLTDSSGNEVSIPFSGSGAQVASYETSFNYDLNGDGTIGVPPPPAPTVIESSGTMSLLTDGTNYFLQANGGTPVELSYGGSPVTVGEFAAYGAWTPIAAAQTASGYEVAWSIPGADKYQIWLTDSSGNELSIPFSGSGAQVASYETSFNDDLNGDGTIGSSSASNPTNGGGSNPTNGGGSTLTVIESSGTMSLLTNGTNYFLQPNGGSAVELSYGGSPVTVNEFAQYGYDAPIAAAQTASGFEVAWKSTSGDQYQIWNTDSSGNYLSSPFLGSGAQAASYETSFNDDLNGDGTIGAPSGSNPTGGEGTTGDSPQFTYAGTDSSGAQVYDVTWSDSGLQPFAVRVLTPTNPSTAYQHSFLYDLPVESGLTQSFYGGSGLDALQALDVEDQYNATIIEPIFPMDSWYADNPNDPTINYETFVADILPQWVDSNFSTTGTEQNLLVGFSKSGYGALDLELKHPSVFSAVAAFDFPGDMTSYDDYGGSSANDYGTQANFQDNYEMNASFIDAHDASFTNQDRILISEGPAFQSQVADFDTLLTSQGVMHTTLDQTNDSHAWAGGWLPGAIAGLYGLEQKLTPAPSA